MERPHMTSCRRREGLSSPIRVSHGRMPPLLGDTLCTNQSTSSGRVHTRPENVELKKNWDADCTPGTGERAGVRPSLHVLLRRSAASSDRLPPFDRAAAHGCRLHRERVRVLYDRTP